MNNTYLVSYDLIKPNKDYTSLIAYLKTYSSWAKPLESVWLLKSSLDASGVRDAIRKHTDSNDKIFVVKVTSETAAWINLSPEVSEWIKNSM